MSRAFRFYWVRHYRPKITHTYFPPRVVSPSPTSRTLTSIRSLSQSRYNRSLEESQISQACYRSPGENGPTTLFPNSFAQKRQKRKSAANGHSTLSVTLSSSPEGARFCKSQKRARAPLRLSRPRETCARTCSRGHTLAECARVRVG